MNIVNISNSTIVRTILWILLVYALFYVKDLVITLLVGLVIASAIDPIAKFFRRYKVPRTVTVSTVFILLILAIVTVAFFVLPSVVDDVVHLINYFPRILESLRLFGTNLGLWDLSTSFSDLLKGVSSENVMDSIKSSLAGFSGVANTTVSLAKNIINILLVLVFSFYLAVEENGVVKFLRLITPKFYEKYVVDLWLRSERKIGDWAKGQIIVSFVIAVLVIIALTIVDMPYASLFALLAFFGEMIPMVGILSAAVPGILVAYFTGGLYFALGIAAIFFVISLIESYVVYPKVMNKVVGIPSIIVLISIIVGATLAGFWGVLLAVPLAAVAMEFVGDVIHERIPKRDSVISQ